MIRTTIALALLLAGTHCRTADATQSFPLSVAAHDDRGDPVPGVEVRAGGRALGRTGADGIFRTALVGRDGERRNIEVIAPPDYRLLSSGRVTGLLQLAAPLGHGTAEPQPVHVPTRLACRTRRYAILVLTNGRADLPVTVGGVMRGATDAWGVAQLLHEGPAGASLSIGIDTRGRPSLRPANPKRRFDLLDQDDVLLLRQDFFEPKPAAKGSPKRRTLSRRRAPRRF